MRRALRISFLLVFSSCLATNVEDWFDPGVLEDFESSEPSGNATSLKAHIALDVGELTVQAGDPSTLYVLEAQYNSSALAPDLKLTRENEMAALYFRLSGEGKAKGSLGKNRVHFRFDPAVALDLETKTGVGRADLDLSGLSVTRLALESGVGETRVSLLSPNAGRCGDVSIRNGVGEFAATGLGFLGFERLVFQGGIGEATLDFSGDWEKTGEVEVNVGVGGVEILLPRNLGAELDVSKSFLSGVTLPEFEKRGDTYYSNNLNRVGTVLRFKIRAGIGGVEIRWI